MSTLLLRARWPSHRGVNFEGGCHPALSLPYRLISRQLREQGGYSQDSFTDRPGYHRNYVGQLERACGTSLPRIPARTPGRTVKRFVVHNFKTSSSGRP
jgi:hypothetical protein